MVIMSHFTEHLITSAVVTVLLNNLFVSLLLPAYLCKKKAQCL
jgi:hypothetical protein